MSKGNSLFSKQLLQEMARDIVSLMAEKSNRLLALALFEEIPLADRSEFITGISRFFQPEILSFLALLRAEYGEEYAKEIARAEKKFSMAGLQPPKRRKEGGMGVFYKAYATVTRHLGKVALNILTKKNRTFSIECFSLHFGSLGIENYILAEDMILGVRERELLFGLEEISYQEAVFLLGEAYEYNCANMNRPALGQCFYRRHLQAYKKISPAAEKELYTRLSPDLTVEKLLNSILLAVSHHDFAYMKSLLRIQNGIKPPSLQSIYNVLASGQAFIEGKVSSLQVNGDQAEAYLYLLMFNEPQIEKCNYHIKLRLSQNQRWELVNIRKTGKYILSDKSKYNPFNKEIFCRVYEIFDGEELLNFLGNIEGSDELEELPYGMHMRFLEDDHDNLDTSWSFLQGILADVVINGAEMVLFCQSLEHIEHYHNLLLPERSSGVRFKQQHTITLGDAYHYINGDCSEFEQILHVSDSEWLYNSALSYLSAHYVVKDMHQFQQYLSSLKVKQIYNNSEQTLYFLYEHDFDIQHFLGEFLLSKGNLLSVSAFGSHNLKRIRSYLEAAMHEHLDFIGLATREKGIFATLNKVYADEYTQLEKEMKAIYLHRWYREISPELGGISPEQACKTAAGSRSLWQTFKRLSEGSSPPAYLLQNSQVLLNDYLEFLDFKKVNN